MTILTRYFDTEQGRLGQSIYDYCTRGLLIPAYILSHWEPMHDYDAYYVFTKNDLKFSLSGQEIVQWLYRRSENADRRN